MEKPFKTYGDLLKELEQQLEAVAREHREVENMWKQAEHARFITAGGCEKCSGRGTMAWGASPLEAFQKNESFGCKNPACTPESRKASGIDLSVVRGRYEQTAGRLYDVAITEDAMHTVFVNPMESVLKSLRQKVNDTRIESSPKKGDEAIVVRGKKFPIGTKVVVSRSRKSKGCRQAMVKNASIPRAESIWVSVFDIEVKVRNG
jgi:hypothetical protein